MSRPHRPVPPPSPSVIDLTSQPELLNPHREAVAATAQMNASQTNPIQTNSTQTTASQTNPIQMNDASVQANPEQHELFRLQQLLKISYAQFVRVQRYNLLFDNYRDQVSFVTDYHCQMMAKIDAYFCMGGGAID